MYRSAPGRFFLNFMGDRERLYYEIPPVCISCGKILEKDDRGTLDHYLPLCITGSSAERERGFRHPLLVVVTDSFNLYRICTQGEHYKLDQEKTRAFLGYNPEDVQAYLANTSLPGTMRGDPVALIRFLREKYPIVGRRSYQKVQTRRMATINNRFKGAALNLNGELDPVLRERYQEAAALIPGFNRYLTSTRYFMSYALAG